MSITVYSCVSYAPTFGVVRTQDHWTALHFVNAIKNRPLAGYAFLPLPSGEAVQIDRLSVESAPGWFAELAVQALSWRDVLPCGLVPVPDAECSLAANRPPRTNRLAEALASALGPDAAAVDLLRWARPMLPTHLAEDSRDPQVLYGRLRVRDRLQLVRDQRFVLVDDVMASGAHMRAVAAFLRDCGATIVCAICAARAHDRLSENGSFLSSSVHELSDFHSDPGWDLAEVYEGVEL
ncbi:MAG TPA: phosphoribosyltransferase [Vicinamibacterales bacterium]|jgi:hypothetical protein|nr:phosphoribosyltransferase [Vicinamibacterales bacterium]